MIDFRIRVLVLDNDFGARQAICGMLQRIGFSNVREDDGRRALALLREHEFGLVLSDMIMASHSGLQLLRAVRQEPRLAKIPFIMTTGCADSAWVQAARDAGIEDYLLKPFDADRLGWIVFRTLTLTQSAASVAGETGGLTAELTEDEPATPIKIQDDRPMLPVHEDGVELYRRYGHLGPRVEGDLPPWQTAFMEWWRFMDRRQALAAVCRRRHMPQ
jgi:two-component system chemotaxis response regulator CheY